MSVIDTATDFGTRVERRLANEQIIWLTTVGNRSGTPQPNPVWFLAQGDEELLIYTIPKTPKLRNISAHPQVALSFNSTPEGSDVVIFQGDARVDADAPAAIDNAEYLNKYREGISHIGMTPQSFSDQFSVAIRVQLTRLRGE